MPRKAVLLQLALDDAVGVAQQCLAASLDPRLVLERGYAFLTDEQGLAITRTAQVRPGQALQATPALRGLLSRTLLLEQPLPRSLALDVPLQDLGLTVPTVKTYRNRAFQRLGIHFRSELFARFGTTRSAAGHH